MERKTVHALLLSLAVVAGGVMMTTDAHAQTNTERLMTTVDNTNSIIAALEALADAVADGFAAVLAAIGAVQTGVDGMSGHLEHLESDVAGISSDVASVDSSVAAVSSDVASIASDVDDISSSLQDVQGDIAGLSAGISGSSAAFAGVNDAVQRNANAINDLAAKLDSISDAVGAVQETVEAPPAEVADPITKLIDESENVDVTLADFAGALNKAPSNMRYEATNSFSCTGDVFVQMASTGTVNSVISGLETDGSTAVTDPVTATDGDLKITVGGQTLYERFFEASEGATAALYSQPITYESPLLLPVGDTLDIVGTTTFNDDNLHRTSTGAANSTHPVSLDAYANAENARTEIAGSDPDSSGDPLKKAAVGAFVVYNVEIEWFATDPTTECSISSAIGTASGLTNTGDVLVGLELLNPDAAPPSQLDGKMVNCSDERTEITKASIRVGHIVDGTALGQYISIVLEAGDESADVHFNSDGTVNDGTSELPFEFSGTDLTVNGTAIQNILVQLDYATVDNNQCK